MNKTEVPTLRLTQDNLKNFRKELSEDFHTRYIDKSVYNLNVYQLVVGNKTLEFVTIEDLISRPITQLAHNAYFSKTKLLNDNDIKEIQKVHSSYLNDPASYKDTYDEDIEYWFKIYWDRLPVLVKDRNMYVFLLNLCLIRQIAIDVCMDYLRDEVPFDVPSVEQDLEHEHYTACRLFDKMSALYSSTHETIIEYDVKTPSVTSVFE